MFINSSSSSTSGILRLDFSIEVRYHINFVQEMQVLHWQNDKALKTWAFLFIPLIFVHEHKSNSCSSDPVQGNRLIRTMYSKSICALRSTFLEAGYFSLRFHNTRREVIPSKYQFDMTSSFAMSLSNL